MLSAIASLAISGIDRPVTALAALNGSVFAGFADGVVEQVGPNLRVEAVIAKATGRRVSFLAASNYGVAWLSGPGGSIREKASAQKPAQQTLTIMSEGRSYSVAIQPSSPICRLSWLEGRVAVSGDLGSTFYDTKGRQVEAASFMPSEVSALAQSSSLWVREQEDGTEFALFARPYAVRRDPRNQKAPLVSLFTAYQVGAWQWAKLGGFASNAFDAFPDGELAATEEGKIASDTKFLVLSDRVGLASDAIVAREPDSLLNVPIFMHDWEISRINAAAVPGDSLWFGSGGEDVWWWTGTALVEQNRRTGVSSAYLPWLDLGPADIHALVADANGIWIGSNKGLRFLDPTKADPQTGYAGCLKVPFGVEATSSVDPDAKKLTDAVFAWRFAEAEKAGQDGGVMVASIYSTLGWKLPQTASELKSQGAPVVDELRFGDVLLTDKSAAVYLSNGLTVVVRDGRVQNGDLWGLTKASVRRFQRPASN